VCILAAACDVLEQLAVDDLTCGAIQVDRATSRTKRVVTAFRNVAVDLGRREQ
jgi:hypothetical protein